ncbi:hypothetical protein [Boudabousia marimammalium]|uniref:Leucine rich repeat variant domain-containing protein n=1 Tax=Boudabousia marimammalium TaxID=156892 RepID=A0A1Q5PM93_9ACTO|nr:hypothetical protein [Boudabousia marimammalium]OKL48656.1 hypothetical protein BM477_05495 [Boudabousia marimammalium]
MSPTPEFEAIAREATDPHIDPNRLRQIAAEYPGLHLAIAQNPVAYEGLLNWLESQGNPEVVAAVQARRRQSELTENGMTGGAALGAAGVAAAGAAGIEAVAGAAGTGATAAGAAGSQAMPFAGGQAAPVQEKARSNNKMVIIFIALAVLAVALVAAAFGLATGFFKFGAESTPTAETVKTIEASDGTVETIEAPAPAPPEPTEETPEDTIKFPEPLGAQEIPAFASPSQNIFCRMDDNEAFCAINTREYANEGPDACFGVFGLKISGKTTPTATCNDASVNQIPGAPPVLQYGQAATFGPYACAMEESGVTCWNKLTGVQFNMRRANFNVSQR